MARMWGRTPKEIARKKKLALILQHMHCPAPGCKGELKVQSLEHAVLLDGYRNPMVPKFYVGCTGEPMHVWRKEDLFYLRKTKPIVIKASDRAKQVKR